MGLSLTADGTVRQVANIAACPHCASTVPAGDTYCCYGCELAAGVLREGAEEHSKTRAALVLSLLLSMLVMMLSLFLYAEDVYEVRPAGVYTALSSMYRWASLLVATPVVVLLGVPLARRAIKALRRGRIGMDLLILVGSSAAYGLSVRAVLLGLHGVYFDSATAALMLSTLGRFLEAKGRAQASRVLGPLLERTRSTVRVVRPDGEVSSSPALVGEGDTLRLDIDETLPVDAVIVGEAVEVNLAVLSGEAAPVLKKNGDTVPAGAVVVSGTLRCVALRSAKLSTLERLAEMSRTLREAPSPLLRHADAFAAVLTPFVVALALATFGYWYWVASPEEATLAALSVVLAACPCTYGAIAPLMLWLGMQKALAHGALVRTPKTMEELAKVDCVAFDKTGTLTDPTLAVTRLAVADGSREADALGWVAAMEAGTRHPVGRALAKFAEENGAKPPPLGARSNLAGRGISAETEDGARLLLGTPSWLTSEGVEGVPREARVVLARGGKVVASFWVGETLRREARAALEALRIEGIRRVVLTGDDPESAARVVADLDLDVRAGLGPEAKVTALRSFGERAAMVGDGLNDGPALAGVGPGFSMDGSSDLARGMAHVALLRADLRLVPWTLGLARRTLRLTRHSLVAATVYNLLFLTLAATGHLRPVWAGVAMATSSLLMLVMALSLREAPGPEGAPS